ncbi:glutathione S-transferase family protein [Hyphococcus sp.]|uniref:glutathione S-transferase family protein n=1 Tax=Hyphococcus sp. TaxID=2038636 RepID=UPI00207F86A6|nr:MAG: glutathione S-transferase [Marinicaulis sp.]
MIQIIGSPISPYVKKVLAVLVLKGIEFEVDPITPFYGNQRFTQISPLRRIPVFIDGDLVLNDSSVIAHYIDETWSTPAALPKTTAARAKTRWLEEYSDSRIGEVFIWKGFAAKVVAPRVFKESFDDDAFQQNLQTGVVEVMTYLESIAPEDGFFCGTFSIADISVAAMFCCMRYAEWMPDASRWPKICAWLTRVEAEPVMATVNKWSDALITAPILERRKIAAEIGLNLTQETLGLKEPRRAAMSQL